MADIGISCATYWNDGYVCGSQLLSNVYEQTAGVLTDSAGGFIESIVETNDLRLAGMQGYCRVRKVLIIGECTGNSHNILIEAAYNSEVAYTDSATFNITGASGNMWQFQWNIPHRRVQAIRFRITDSAQAGNLAPSYIINGISLSVEKEPGMARVPVANRKD